MKKKILVLTLAVVLFCFSMTACTGGRSLADVWGDLWGNDTDTSYNPFPHEPTPKPGDAESDVAAKQFYEVSTESSNSTSFTWDLHTESLKSFSSRVDVPLNVNLANADKAGVLFLRKVTPGALTLTFTLMKSTRATKNPLNPVENWGVPLAIFTNALSKIVDSTEKLHVGMVVDIIAGAGTPITRGVTITDINQETKALTLKGLVGSITTNAVLWLPTVYEQEMVEFSEESQLQFVKPLPEIEFGKGYKFMYDGNFSIDWEEI